MDRGERTGDSISGLSLPIARRGLAFRFNTTTTKNGKKKDRCNFRNRHQLKRKRWRPYSKDGEKRKGKVVPRGEENRVTNAACLGIGKDPNSDMKSGGGGKKGGSISGRKKNAARVGRKLWSSNTDEKEKKAQRNKEESGKKFYPVQ